MKTSFIIRMVAAAIVATLASVGYLAAVPSSLGLFSISGLLVIPREELTRPIPRNESWWTFLVVGVLVAVFLTLPFLHLQSPFAPSVSVRFALAAPLWLLWMWAIYRRCQREKVKAAA